MMMMMIVIIIAALTLSTAEQRSSPYIPHNDFDNC